MTPGVRDARLVDVAQHRVQVDRDGALDEDRHGVVVRRERCGDRRRVRERDVPVGEHRDSGREQHEDERPQVRRHDGMGSEKRQPGPEQRAEDRRVDGDEQEYQRFRQ